VRSASVGIGATMVNGCGQVPPGMAAVAIRDLARVGYWAAWREERQERAQAFLAVQRRTRPATGPGGSVGIVKGR
jgi:hypothetical protein